MSRRSSPMNPTVPSPEVVLICWRMHQYREFAITSCDVMLCYRHQMSPMKLWMIWWKHQIWHVITITTTYIFSLGRCWFAPCFDSCNSIRTILQVLIEWPPCWCGFVLLSRVAFGECNEVWVRSSSFCVSIPTHGDWILEILLIGLFLESSLTFDVLWEGDKCWA